MSIPSIRQWALFALCAAALTGCDNGNDGNDSNDLGGGQGATESNFQPAPCDEDSDCGDGGTCMIPEGADMGTCDADEMVVGGPSSAAPAPCASDTDCPEGVSCEGAGGDAGGGYCDVSETTVSSGGGTSLGAPAPCSADGDCGGNRCVLEPGASTGYCDVDEMIAP